MKIELDQDKIEGTMHIISTGLKSLLIALLVILGTPNSFALEVSGEKGSKQVTENTILEVKTVEGDKISYRAVISKIKSRYDIKIEKFERSQKLDGLGILIATINVLDLPGGKELKINDGWHVTELNWIPSGLTFKSETASGSLIKTIHCKVSVFSKDPNVICK